MRSNSIPWGAFFEGVERRCRKEESATAVSPNRSMRKKSKASKKPNSHRQQQSVRCRVALYCLFWFFFFLFFFLFFLKLFLARLFLGLQRAAAIFNLNMSSSFCGFGLVVGGWCWHVRTTSFPPALLVAAVVWCAVLCCAVL